MTRSASIAGQAAKILSHPRDLVPLTSIRTTGICDALDRSVGVILSRHVAEWYDVEDSGRLVKTSGATDGSSPDSTEALYME